MEIIEQIGFYDDPGEKSPAHNPCLAAPCCVCGLPNGKEPLTWISILAGRGVRSYFFAHHRRCKGSPKIADFEERVVSEIFDWEDATIT